MKLIKLTALPLLLFSLALAVVSCEPDAEQKKLTEYEKKGIILHVIIIIGLPNK